MWMRFQGTAARTAQKRTSSVKDAVTTSAGTVWDQLVSVTCAAVWRTELHSSVKGATPNLCARAGKLTVMRFLPACAAALSVVTVAACSHTDPPTFPDMPVYDAATAYPYVDGYLPVGDGLFDSTAPRQGFVYTCPGFAASLGNNGIGGAVERGEWFSDDGLWWNPALKPHVRGDIPVPGRFDMTVRDGRRIIDTNSLPAAHTIGEFPVSPDDPVHDIDPNPNTSTEHDHVYDLPAAPGVADAPGCVGHQVGVLTRGAALFSPLDAQGRDAVAWEVQDHCDGHPEPDGTYHYHGMSPCLPGMDTDQVVGFALDGFPITGNRTPDDTLILSRDLDECHGRWTTVELDGQKVETYSYALTEDYPYTVSCFRGGAVTDER